MNQNGRKIDTLLVDPIPNAAAQCRPAMMMMVMVMVTIVVVVMHTWQTNTRLETKGPKRDKKTGEDKGNEW